MGPSIENWVFLGDSLVEGVGSSRVSFVNEIVKQLREKSIIGDQNSTKSVDYIRLRGVNPTDFNPFIKTNLAAYYEPDKKRAHHILTIWNLASEGTTIEDDVKWLALLNIIKPNRIIIFRGSLEKILRPINISNGQWPWWIPKPWRREVAMDPRCYFSSTWWRKIKQIFIDALKQRIRHYLLAKYGSAPLMKQITFNNSYKQLLVRLIPLNAKITLCGLLPVDNNTFPDSDKYFSMINNYIRELSNDLDLHYLDWGKSAELRLSIADYFYRDGFHPNINGAKFLAHYFLEDMEKPE